MPTVTVADADVHFSLTGSGPGLIMLHGTQAGAEASWGHVVGSFGDSRTVITPDLSGSGRTTDGGAPLSVEGLTDQVVAVARVAAPGPVDLVGASLGAVVAAATAAHHPELIRSLVLIAGWAHGDDVRHRLNFGLWRDLARADFDLFSRFGMLQGFTPGYLSALSDEGLNAVLAANLPAPGLARQIALDLQADIRELLPKISARTLVIGLTRDQIVPVERSRELQAAIPGSTYAEVDSGHFAIFEKTAEMVGLIRSFLLTG
ncbi:alpha/beta fold hydrolase [Nonomuraea africana]|uniref:Pimeloyl-ACP methyl ester carboxylesterase n=1 Tax=Nonomuraea africana TaxID=46171 RepID=A0ABR9KG52_9ACTN|nr:alpha/beta hydrolase [Nonomuraea africana]MBE1560517.1 pimeloyl-ACP methyl ester carboxylesterase [Nonomuraea africana]